MDIRKQTSSSYNVKQIIFITECFEQILHKILTITASKATNILKYKHYETITNVSYILSQILLWYWLKILNIKYDIKIINLQRLNTKITNFYNLKKKKKKKKKKQYRFLVA